MRKLVLLFVLFSLPAIKSLSKEFQTDSTRVAGLIEEGIGDVRQGDFELALKKFNKAEEMVDSSPEGFTDQAAQLYNEIGRVHYMMYDYRRSRDYFLKIADNSDKLTKNKVIFLAKILHSLGAINYELREYEASIDNFRKALTYYKRDETGEYVESLSKLYGNIGLVHLSLGDYSKSRSNLKESLRLIKTSGQDESISLAYYQLAAVDYLTGNYQLSMNNAKISLSLTANDNLKARIYNRMALILEKQSKTEEALNLFSKGLEIATNPYERKGLLSNASNIYFSQGNLDLALDNLLETLQIERDLMPGEELSILTYNNIGDIFSERKEYDSARFYYEKAFAIQSVIATVGRDMSLVCNSLAYLFYEYGNYDKAAYYAQKSLIANDINFTDPNFNSNPSGLNIADLRDLLSAFLIKMRISKARYEASDDISHLELANETYERVLYYLKEMRRSISDIQDKLIISELGREIFEEAINLKIARFKATGNEEFLRAIFNDVEKSKSQVLLQTLTYSEAIERSEIDDKFLDKLNDLNIKTNYLRDIIFQESDEVNYDSAFIVAKTEELVSTDNAYDSLIKELEVLYPDYYALKYKENTTTIEIIQDRLENDDLLLEYFVGDSMGYVLKITKNDFAVEPIQQMDSLVNLARAFRETVSDNSLINSDGSIRELMKVSHQLYVGLLEPHLKEESHSRIRNLIIIPDSELGYLPFDLFLTDDLEESSNLAEYPYLIKDYTIRYSYSASLLANQINKEAGTNSDYVSFAPSYQNSNPSDTRDSDPENLRSSLSELVWSEEEVRSIDKRIAGQNFIGKNATEKAFKQVAEKANILHLAMHAFVDNKFPMRSKLFFYQDENSIEDGNLHIFELYNLKLNADLAVLSACETGYGKLDKGEGIRSLARGFAYAGVPSIVMSHWKVDDQATNKIMTGFYKFLADGERKSAALRKAKLAYIEETNPEKLHPFFWGAFVVVGNDSPIVSDDHSLIIIILSAMLVMLLTIFLIYNFFKNRKRKR
ncbi:MAG: CHAT domain-containing tetratricopeptide repeat protein [Cyclobacteriaceae bacterium]